MSESKVKIIHYSITEDMKVRAIEYALQQEKSKQEFEAMAKSLKREFDSKFHPTWQCVVGKNFGSDIGYFDKHMIYFYIGNIAILLWKAG